MSPIELKVSFNRRDKIVLGVVGALAIGVLGGFLLTRSNPCLSWQKDYLTAVDEARATNGAEPTDDVDLELLEERPGDCPAPATDQLGPGTSPVVVEGVSLPREIPLIVTSDHPDLTITGHTAELAGVQGADGYQGMVDFSWNADDPPETLYCDVGYVGADEPIIVFDESIAFDRPYLDDWPVGRPLDWLMLYFKADGPPSAMNVRCGDSQF